MIDDDTVIGHIDLVDDAIHRPACDPNDKRPIHREPLRLSDLDSYWQGRLMVIDAVDNARTVELEADLERVAEERDEALAQCNILGRRGDEMEAKLAKRDAHIIRFMERQEALEARLAKAEAALEAADKAIDFLGVDETQSELVLAYVEAREAMK